MNDYQHALVKSGKAFKFWKLKIMRMHVVGFCLVSLCVYSSIYSAEAATSAELAKAEFVKAVPMIKGTQKLLESSGDRLYFSMADGSVAVTDLDGKLLQTLQAKEGGDPILKKPEAIAFGEGVVYVADSEQGQIAMFSKDGKYQRSFGAKKGGFFGSGGGNELKKPRGVAYHEGIVYVLDAGTKRILMYGSNGVFINPLEIKLGSDAKVSKGQADEYKLRDPVEIKIDRAGRLYVLDSEDSLVKVYNADGIYLQSVLWDGALAGLAVAQDGLYIAKENEYTIQKYDFNEKFLYKFGARGEGQGQFNSISGLALAKDRQVIVADVTKGIINIFVADTGIPIEAVPKLASRVFVQSTGEVISVAVNKFTWNGKDTIFGVDTDQDAVIVIRNGKPEKTIKIADVTPIAVAVDAAGAPWVLDKKKYRVIKLDATNGKIVSSFGSEGSADGKFDSPTDLVISASGKFYVSDKGSDSVQIFDAEGKFLSAVHKLGGPVSIAVDETENLYVLENSKSAISIFSPQGMLVGNLGKEKEENPGNLVKPGALMVTSEEVFVLDGNAVKVYSRKGVYLRSFGAKGARQGEFDEPVAIVRKDDMSFYIAEKSNKRIQSFLTQYKPTAPGKFAAKNGLHSIELNWESIPLPYIKQYAIYRSKIEHAGFVRVGTSSTNQYIDRGLEPEGTYFYYVAAETSSGFEGATSALVSGTSKRYTPPVLAGVDVVNTPWQIKLSWKPIESEFVNSYIVYQKEGEAFTKVGEALNPEFTKDMLTPNTKYTFYIAAHSTDGGEAEKFEVKTTTLPFNKPPLEFELLNLRPVFANTFKNPGLNGIGTIKIINNTDKEIEGITFSYMIKDFMDFASESKLEKILPGKSIEVIFNPIFNNNVANVLEDTSVQTTLEASYYENGKRESYVKNVNVKLYEKHKMFWDEPERFATFVTPKDPQVMAFVKSIVAQYPDTKDAAIHPAAVFNALGVYGMTYVQNPSDAYLSKFGNASLVDSVQFPRETLEHKSGDYVELVALYAAALESMGISTRVVEVPDHTFMMFSTGIKAESDAYTVDGMYVIYDDMLWIPVETTLVGNSFSKAWETGSANYNKWNGKGLEILNISQAWQKYKPASLPDSKSATIQVSRDGINKKFPNDYLSVIKIGSQLKIRPYLQKIEKDPNDIDSHLQIGIILAKFGDTKEAMKYFDKILSLQADNAAAQNNRGNLLMMDDKFVDAQKAYRGAATASPDDPLIWINLAKAYKSAHSPKEAKKAFAKAQSLDPDVKKKYRELSLEFSN
jgi:tetratricopeptide (TPR) repeat protein/sugar lactone lactonase YvrE